MCPRTVTVGERSFSCVVIAGTSQGIVVGLLDIVMKVSILPNTTFIVLNEMDYIQLLSCESCGYRFLVSKI